MIKRIYPFYIILGLIFILTSCANNYNERNNIQLTVSAAISLSDVLIELKDTYEQRNHDIEIIFNFGGSGTLAQQIQQGAPVDIFISANDQWMNTLEKEQLVVPNTLTAIAMNELVLIGSTTEENNQSIDSYLTKNGSTIAIGHPETVPAGKYAKQTLDHYELYNPLQAQIIFAKDVRQVLTYVETGNADYGFVYKSDMTNAENSQTLIKVDSKLHDEISYPAAVITDTENKQAAKEFLDFLTSEVASDIFKAYGFSKPSLRGL